MEALPRAESHEAIFEAAHQAMLEHGINGFTEIPERIPKANFLEWLVREKGYLLHGSGNQHIPELEPRQANCRSKEFGNMKAVYACEDAILPIFNAIINRKMFRGMMQSGVSMTTDENGAVERSYGFGMSREMITKAPWTRGAVYILPRDTFVQGHDNDGNPIDEWASRAPVTPLGKIEAAKEDFPYFNNIQPLDE